MLKRMFFSGFKSFSAARPMDVDFGKINVLLGANGAGKSNLLSVFSLLNAMNNGQLQQYVAMENAALLLNGGPQKTSGIILRLEFAVPENKISRYALSLKYGLPNRLYIADESVEWTTDGEKNVRRGSIYSDLNESGLRNNLDDEGVAIAVRGMTNVYMFQFNNTSIGSPIRLMSGVYDCAALRRDGGNLAAYIRQLKIVEGFRPYYDRIVAFVRSVVPQFWDFRLDAVDNGSVWLTWQDRTNPGYVYGPNQLSDGSIRFVALAAALLSPPKLMPGLMLLDEPELGLHPHAIDKLVGMIKIASVNSQIIVATQAPRLVDGFEADQVRLVESDRRTGETVITKPDSNVLASWVGRYSTSELWEKNILDTARVALPGGQ